MAEANRIHAVLCLFQGEDCELQAVNIAFGLTTAYRAALRILHVVPPVMSLVDPYGAGALAGAIVSETLVAQFVAGEEAAKTGAAKATADYASIHGMLLCRTEADFLAAVRPKAVFMAEDGPITDCVVEEARFADVVVTARPDSFSTRRPEVIAALLDTGRPVLLAPPVTCRQPRYEWRGERIGVAWDGSHGASKALMTALMLADSAKAFYLVSVAEDGLAHDGQDSLAMAAVRDRGLQPVIRTLAKSKETTGSRLLQVAHELQLDCLAMGAFGHNSMIERLFGGTSQYMLDHADLPLLMAH